jgi:nicotinamide mononucleotide transporter PnuC
MNNIKNKIKYFSRGELAVWLSSLFLIVASFCLFDRSNYFTFAASLIGVTALIFCAKGNPFGQVLMIIFCLFYAFISYTFSYYGEMITYLGMSVPMAVFALISWLRNPYEGNKSEVKVNRIKRGEIAFMLLLTAGVTIVFYFVLSLLGTANIFFSTFSVTTSFMAVYLTFRRSPFFALAYALNDIVLMVLWALASMADISYISVVVCFAVFLINDIYGFISWLKMGKRQGI